MNNLRLKTTTMNLEEICCYAPFGLKGILTADYREDYFGYEWANLEDFKEGTIWQLAGYADSDLCIPLGEGEFAGLLWRNESTYTCFHGNGIKPLMRPLSDLTREIEHNGEKFVPIVELSKMLFHNTSNWGEFEYIGIDEAEQLYELQIQFKPKGIDIKPYTQYAIPMNPEKMSWKVIKKLHEWHFWLGDQSRFGKDIIDINTLNE